MHTTVTIQNIKCDDCKNAVTICLEAFCGISNIKINISKKVSFNYTKHNTMEGSRSCKPYVGFLLKKLYFLQLICYKKLLFIKKENVIYNLYK